MRPSARAAARLAGQISRMFRGARDAYPFVQDQLKVARGRDC